MAEPIQIGDIQIHLDTYGGADSYSDGPIEDDLLEIVRSHKDTASVLADDPRWPVTYHLHPSRENLLAWYDFDGTEDVLEIGSGCGALTGLLASRCRSVTCSDISLKRCEINAWKNVVHENIEMHAGNFADLAISRRFDVVTLIGVLEYACSYYPAGKGSDPFEMLLGAARGFLKPDGVLMVAIENKFGLKYWAGAREDHTGCLYDNLHGYPGPSLVRTFSREELADLLSAAGLPFQEFYYPYPDYKFCQEIYSDARLPRPGELGDPMHNYDQDRVVNFDEAKVFTEVIRAGAFPFFANSFLVLARQEANDA